MASHWHRRVGALTGALAWAWGGCAVGDGGGNGIAGVFAPEGGATGGPGPGSSTGSVGSEGGNPGRTATQASATDEGGAATQAPTGGSAATNGDDATTASEHGATDDGNGSTGAATTATEVSSGPQSTGASTTGDAEVGVQPAFGEYSHCVHNSQCDVGFCMTLGNPVTDGFCAIRCDDGADPSPCGAAPVGSPVPATCYGASDNRGGVVYVCALACDGDQPCPAGMQCFSVPEAAAAGGGTVEFCA